MDSPRTLPLQTAHNPSSSPKSSWILNKTLPLQTVHNPPPQQPEVEMNSIHKTLLLQTVHNLRSSPTGPAEFATKHRPRKLFTTFPAAQDTAEFSTKTYLCKLFTTPTFSQSPAGLSTTPCPGKQYTTDSNKTLSCKLLSTSTEA